MPYFQIRIWLKNRSKPSQGIRYYDIYNIDEVFRLVNKKAREKFKEDSILKVDCCMLPTASKEVQKILAKSKVLPETYRNRSVRQTQGSKGNMRFHTDE